MKFTKNIGFLLLAIWLILTGLSYLAGLMHNIGFLLLAIWLILTGLSAFISFGGLAVILAILAIAAGVFILLGR